MRKFILKVELTTKYESEDVPFGESCTDLRNYMKKMKNLSDKFTVKVEEIIPNANTNTILYIVQTKNPRVIIRALDTVEEALKVQKKYHETSKEQIEIIVGEMVPLSSKVKEKNKN